MICKRCESQITKRMKTIEGYCRHCYQALKQKPYSHSQWVEGTNWRWK